MRRNSAQYLGCPKAAWGIHDQIEFIDKDVDHPNGIILANPVFQAFGKQRALPAIQPLNEAPHPIPPQIA